MAPIAARRPHTSQGTSRGEITPFNLTASSRFMPLPTLPQSPVTQTGFGLEETDKSDIVPTDEYSRSETPRPSTSTSTSRSPSVMARMFVPRKKVTSISSVESDSTTTHGHHFISAASLSRKKTISITSVASNAGEPPPSQPDYSVGLSARKDLEPVGYIAKPLKKSIWKKTSQDTRRSHTSSSFSASTASLDQQTRVPRRSASATESGGNGWRLFGRKRRDSELDQATEDAVETESDEIDEIRRPSDLGPAAEVMATLIDDEKPLPGLPAEGEDSQISLPHREHRDQGFEDQSLISCILGFLPASEVARCAVVSKLWLTAARSVLYGCIDLRLDTISVSKDTQASADEERTAKRRKIRQTLQLVVETLKIRNGQLFEGTFGLLLDEWPFGWDPSEAELDSDDVHDDTASVHTEYTAYSESDFTTTVSDTLSLLLDIPPSPGRISKDRSSSPVYQLNMSPSPVKTSFDIPRVPIPKSTRLSPQALMTTLIASLPSLATLCLPAFHAPIMRHHVAFGLRKVEFLLEGETEEMLRWLDGLVGVVEVRVGSNRHEPCAPDVGTVGKNASKVEVKDRADTLGKQQDARPRSATKGRKRKTFLIISAPESPSSSSSSTPLASATFPGTSFPMPPPTSALEKRASTLSTPGSADAADKRFSVGRPSSPLLPPGLDPLAQNIQPLSSPAPLKTEAEFRVTEPPSAPQTNDRSDSLSPTSSASQSPVTSAYHTPTLRPSTPNTPSTPLSPMDPIRPLTPFAQSLYLYSMYNRSLPLTPFQSSHNNAGIRELCLKETLLPSLQVFHGPPNLVNLLVPPRRKTIQEVRVIIRGTIVGGEVKVGEVVRGLTFDEKCGKEDVLKNVGLYFAEDTDRRTVEKVLGAVGVVACPSEEAKEKNSSVKGIGILDIVLAPGFRTHPNLKKSDEVSSYC
ncbi:hypothetical protein Moror_4068 [Moniliophthora roreri MCA 2997]|uniref:F-box domain-containing protein n=1 Tax=Moniliophthora roreri (strain MCA 2997) TaxID=1381753 RepID=V2XD92_MONRO|nr:hypothetical protein Moror_4068 [Moniliophthora roreri MCA 2997]